MAAHAINYMHALQSLVYSTREEDLSPRLLFNVLVRLVVRDMHPWSGLVLSFSFSANLRLECERSSPKIHLDLDSPVNTFAEILKSNFNGGVLSCRLMVLSAEIAEKDTANGGAATIRNADQPLSPDILYLMVHVAVSIAQPKAYMKTFPPRSTQTQK